MRKKYIYSIIISIISLIIFFSFFYQNFNNDAKEEFVKPQIAFKNSFFSVQLKYLEKKPEFDITAIKNLKDKKKFDNKLKNKILELLNMPFKKIPESQILNSNYEVIDKGKYTQNKISLLTSDVSLTSAYLLIPKNINFPAPAIIAMHPHGNFYEYGKDWVVGNIGNPDLFYGKELAERGYIVLSIDSALFGDRVDVGKNSREKEEIREAQNLLLLGHPLLGVVVQEDVVSLDFLYSLDIVNKSNIGCIGHSFGGIRCMYLAALDNRIKTTVISSAIANTKRNIESGETHSWLTILPGIAKYTETSGILALISPRPLMIIHTTEDQIFNANEALEQINLVKKLYSILNKESNFNYFFIKDEAHTFPKEVHNLAYEFFDKNLKSNI